MEYKVFKHKLSSITCDVKYKVFKFKLMFIISLAIKYCCLQLHALRSQATSLQWLYFKAYPPHPVIRNFSCTCFSPLQCYRPAMVLFPNLSSPVQTISQTLHPKQTRLPYPVPANQAPLPESSAVPDRSH